MPNSLREKTVAQRGFSLLELMVAMGITLVITGSMYGLIASSQGAFRREPALIDRQQQIRIAMTRIQEDVRVGGLGLGNFFQAFGAALDGASPIPGVTAAQQTDILEIRTESADCPQARLCPNDGVNYPGSQDCQPNNGPNTGAVLQFVEPVPACYPVPGFAVILYGDGNAKVAWGHTVVGDTAFNLPPGQAQAGSEVDDVIDISCSVTAAPGGGPTGTCPANNWCGGVTGNLPCAYSIVTLEMIRYQIGIDPTDGAPGLYRSTTGGYNVADPPVQGPPPGVGWQLIARGIEDLQVQYRTLAGFQNAAPPVAAPNFDNIVREVQITLWARTVGENQLQGESLAAGNGVTAVRGSMMTSVAPRAAQIALTFEPNPANRWQ